MVKCPKCNSKLEIKVIDGVKWYYCKNCDYKISKGLYKLLNIYKTALNNLSCPYCEKEGFKGFKGLKIHIAQKHKGKLKPNNIKEFKILEDKGEEELKKERNKVWIPIDKETF